MTMSLPRRLARVSGLGLVVVHGYRATIAARHFAAATFNVAKSTVGWLLTSREYTNYTYSISAMCRTYMAATVAVVVDQPCGRVLEMFEEAEADEALGAHIRRAVASSPDRYSSNQRVQFGRRLCWYAVVRLTRPKVVVETGVDRGLGSCLIAAALKRNAEAGHPGFYYGTDINPAAGHLLGGPYREHGEILLGDSIRSLQQFPHTIDVFINDSDHSADYEGEEYLVVDSKLNTVQFQAALMTCNRRAAPGRARAATSQRESVRRMHRGCG